MCEGICYGMPCIFMNLPQPDVLSLTTAGYTVVGYFDNYLDTIIDSNQAASVVHQAPNGLGAVGDRPLDSWWGMLKRFMLYFCSFHPPLVSTGKSATNRWAVSPLIRVCKIRIPMHKFDTSHSNCAICNISYLSTRAQKYGAVSSCCRNVSEHL